MNDDRPGPCRIQFQEGSSYWPFPPALPMAPLCLYQCRHFNLLLLKVNFKKTPDPFVFSSW
ncbi:MAG: hypothetical protein ABI955_05070, partial [Nitrospirota bacterium]